MLVFIYLFFASCYSDFVHSLCYWMWPLVIIAQYNEIMNSCYCILTVFWIWTGETWTGWLPGKFPFSHPCSFFPCVIISFVSAFSAIKNLFLMTFSLPTVLILLLCLYFHLNYYIQLQLVMVMYLQCCFVVAVKVICSQ